MVRLPAAIYMRIAEVVGAWVLRAWLVVLPFLLAGWRVVRRWTAVAQREITPPRMAVGVALAVCVALAGSQWADLRGISVGTDAYTGVEEVAPAPEVETKSVGSVHSWVGLPLALLGGLLVLLAARGRPRLALGLVPIGIAVVALSLLVDRPEGLDKGVLEIQYESVTATLLDGYWAQLVSGIVLILLAPMLTRTLQTAPAGEPRRGARRRARSADSAPGKSRRAMGRAAEAGQ